MCAALSAATNRPVPHAHECVPWRHGNMHKCKGRYALKVGTGSMRNAATDGIVTIKVSGDDGESGWVLLGRSINSSNPFERASEVS